MLPLLVTNIEVALAGVVAGRLVGVAAPLFTWLIARSNRLHERRLAHEARISEHRSRLYDDILRQLSFEARGFWMIHRAAEGNPIPEEEAEAFPDPDWLHRAAMTASPDVLEALQSFIDWAIRFGDASETYEIIEGEREDSPERVEELRQMLRELGGEIFGDRRDWDEAIVARQMIREAAEGARDQIHAIEEAARKELMEFRP